MTRFVAYVSSLHQDSIGKLALHADTVLGIARNPQMRIERTHAEDRWNSGCASRWLRKIGVLIRDRLQERHDAGLTEDDIALRLIEEHSKPDANRGGGIQGVSQADTGCEEPFSREESARRSCGYGGHEGAGCTWDANVLVRRNLSRTHKAIDHIAVVQVQTAGNVFGADRRWRGCSRVLARVEVHHVVALSVGGHRVLKANAEFKAELP